jgi:hypothetical protein
MMMRIVALLAALAPAAGFKLPWSRSASPKSGGYQLGILAVGKTLMHGCPLIMWEDVTSCVEINQ